MLQRGLIVIVLYTLIPGAPVNSINYYVIDTVNYDHINRVWDWCQNQGRNIPMYRTRVALGQISWLVECPSTSVQSMFLLNFSQWVSQISPPGG